MSKTCKKKQSSKNRMDAIANTFARKVAKLEAVVAKNPNDYIARSALTRLQVWGLPEMTRRSG